MAYKIPEDFPGPGDGRVALLGDTHANTWWTLRVIKALADEGVKTVVHLGDFGWWPQLAFARKISRDATKAGVKVLFLDGNHEHHLNLRKSARNADPESDNGRPVQLHPNLWYLPHRRRSHNPRRRHTPNPKLGHPCSTKLSRTLNGSWFAGPLSPFGHFA